MKHLFLFMLCVISSKFFAQPGTLDPAFGTGGKVITDIANDEDRAYAVAAQPDGKIVVAGWAESGNNRNLVVLRLLPDGSPDPGFGMDGQITIGPWQNCRALVIQPDGKILVAGWGGLQFVYVVRLLPTGFPDVSFGINGIAGVSPSNLDVGIFDMVLHTNGKIVIGGYAYNQATARNEFLLVRFNADGTNDTGFGVNGIVKTVFGGFDNVWVIGLALQSDGKILATGFAEYSGNYDVSLARYHPNGSLDNTFSDDGRVTTNLGSDSDEAESVFALPDGKIVVLANTVQNGNYVPTLIRYKADGSLDNSFGSGGMAFFPLPFPVGGVLRGLLQPDGKFVGVGFSNGAGLIRFNTDGTPDQNFGSGGFALANADVLRGIALQPDGKIVVAGDDDNDFVVLRYLSDLSIGTQEPGNAFTFSIQPNPASDFIEISTKTNFPKVGNFQKVEALLYDSNNRLLRSAEFENNLHWEVGSLPAGVYWVQIQGVEKRSIGRFVKK